jgi:hypothetical protein
MKFEMAATDASENRDPQPGAATGPANSFRHAPFAARLEVKPWMVTEFNLPIKTQEPIPTTEPNSLSIVACA